MRSHGKQAAFLIVMILVAATLELGAAQNDTSSHIPPGHNTFVPPPKGQSYSDPAFGTEIWRVTDAIAAGRDLLTTEYASQAATNADDTMVRIITNGGGGTKFFATTPPFNLLRTKALAGTSPSDFWWHPTDPNILYHLAYDGRLLSYNFATDTDSVVAAFPYGNVQGLGENQFSLDGNRIAAAANSGAKIFVYELSSDSIIAEFDSSALWLGDVTISPNGSRVLVSNRHVGGASDMFVYTIGNGTLNFERDLGQGYGHKDVGQSPNGEDYLIAVESWWTNHIRAVRLSDGAATVILPLGWNPAANSALHISANSMFRDGWVYISTYSPQDPNPQVLWPTYFQEVFRMSFDGSVIERLAHNRTRYDVVAGDRYYSMPRATISRSGNLLFFASNMRQRVISNPNLPPDYSDTYMIDLGSGGAGGLSAPSNLQAGGFPDPRVDLTWSDNSSNENAFEVLRKGPNDPAFQLLTFLGANVTSFQDLAVVAGQPYCYRVVAHAGNATSGASNTACATPAAVLTPPAAPTGLAATAPAATSVDLGWTDNASNEDVFDVRRRGPGEQSFTNIATLPANTTAYQDGAVVAGQQFCYEVLAQNNAGNSPTSNAACATPSAPPPPPPPPPPGPDPDPEGVPPAPSSLRVQIVGDRRVQLSWTDNSNNETRFEIHRQRDGDGYRRVAQLDPNATTYLDRRIRGRRTYCYVVLARNNAGVSRSDEVCVTIAR